MVSYGCNPKRTALSNKGGIWAVYDREWEMSWVNGKGCFIGRWIFKTPNFTNTKWRDNVSDSRLIIALANGKRKMPDFQKVDLVININKEPASSIRRYIIETTNFVDTILETLGKDFLTDNDNARKGLMGRSRIAADLLNKLPLKRKLSDEEES